MTTPPRRARRSLRRLSATLRNNAIALLALFVALGGTAYAANTIRSADIVDGEVKTPDLGADAVVSAKIAPGTIVASDIAPDSIPGSRIKNRSLVGTDVVDDSLTGADIAESTLGPVPSSDGLGGAPAEAFRPGASSAAQRTDACLQVGTYRECAPVTIVVPSGRYFKVTVDTSMTIFGTGSAQGLFCAASEGPSCLSGHPSGFTTQDGQYTNVSDSYSQYFGPGTHRFNMAVRMDGATYGAVDTAFTRTNVRWHDYGAEAARAATRAAVRRQVREAAAVPSLDARR